MTGASGTVASKRRILIVAGEVSGEQHAAGLIGEMRTGDGGASIEWFGAGGAAMREAGVELLQDVSDLAAIGPWDALRHLHSYWRLFRRLVSEARQRKPDLAVLVDFPEFNLRLAPRLKALGIPVCYFISPQLWAWRSSRLKIIKRYVDLMLVIFPFEEEYYRSRGVPAHYVGNPTKNFGDMILNSQTVSGNSPEAKELSFVSPKFPQTVTVNSPDNFGDMILNSQTVSGNSPEAKELSFVSPKLASPASPNPASPTKFATAAPRSREQSRPFTVALLPGSRRKEVERLLPIMLDAARYIADRLSAKFWVIKAPAVRRDQLECIYKNWAANAEEELPLEIREDQSAHVLARADCAIIKSGTSTLEATVLQVPFAMAYRLARPSWYLVRPFATTDTYCLTNLIAGTRVVPEFVQDEATGSNIGSYIVGLLEDNNRLQGLRERLAGISGMLGDSNAYREAARWISKLLLEGSRPQ